MGVRQLFLMRTSSWLILDITNKIVWDCLEVRDIWVPIDILHNIRSHFSFAIWIFLRNTLFCSIHLQTRECLETESKDKCRCMEAPSISLKQQKNNQRLLWANSSRRNALNKLELNLSIILQPSHFQYFTIQRKMPCVL